MALFVRLDVNWPNHHKLIQAGLDGRGLHATALCLAKSMESDGWLHRSLLHREGASDELIGRLVELRLLEQDGDRFRPWGWHDRNPSQAAIDATRTAKRDAAREGNHRRWAHPGDVATCPKCNAKPQVSRTSDRTPIAPASQTVAPPSPESETETETYLLSSQSDPPPDPAAADGEDRGKPPDPQRRPTADDRRARADAACDLIGDRNAQPRLTTGDVRDPDAWTAACRRGAHRDHHGQAIDLAGRHPDWTPTQIADHLTRPAETTTVPADQSTHPELVRERMHPTPDPLPPRPDDITDHLAAARAAITQREPTA